MRCFRVADSRVACSLRGFFDVSPTLSRRVDLSHRDFKLPNNAHVGEVTGLIC
jgi:hypothetical protein